MADIITALDDLVQPRAAPRGPSNPLSALEQDEADCDAVIAQIQYDIIERAYFQRTVLTPLPPTPNGKVKAPCETCNDLTFEPIFRMQPRAVRTETLHGVLPSLKYMNFAAECDRRWFPRRHKTASWDVHDESIRASLLARIERLETERLKREKKRDDNDDDNEEVSMEEVRLLPQEEQD